MAFSGKQAGPAATLVDAELYLPQKRAKTDRSSKRNGVPRVRHAIQEIVEGKCFKLSEALAEDIASLLRTYTSIVITIRVIKPHPPFKIFSEEFTVEIAGG